MEGGHEQGGRRLQLGAFEDAQPKEVGGAGDEIRNEIPGDAENNTYEIFKTTR